jgi:hypothetical protein
MEKSENPLDTPNKKLGPPEQLSSAFPVAIGSVCGIAQFRLTPPCPWNWRLLHHLLPKRLPLPLPPRRPHLSLSLQYCAPHRNYFACECGMYIAHHFGISAFTEI